MLNRHLFVTLGDSNLKNERYNIAIFDTFKTQRAKFTGEAKRQRGIIAHLATEQSPELRTRTSIAHVIAKKHGILWQNIYSGIFKDLDEVLIPSGVVRECGRLPLRRGPKALQLEGVPFYELTGTGLLVASSIEEIGEDRMKILETYFQNMLVKDENEKILYNGILLLIRFAPAFVIKVISEYIYAYTTGSIDAISPIDLGKFQTAVSKQISVECQLIEAFDKLLPEQKDIVKSFLRAIR
jgi:hypothetical protein